ncbi:MAG: RNA polymerase sporulation sigma factor SigK [Epulopiscium sp.]|jgi:RNA polymerase sporulation-specific sigma factor|nr:RNA polymerase sporulation sigma factor SigK [Candidatus Epulonipiscium sp.]
MLSGLLSSFFILSFVSYSSSFPKPLSQEDEKKYLELYATGTEEEKQEARNILIEHNLRLVAHIAKKYAGFQKDSEDLISAGTIGLIKAVSSYDASKCIRLATYASRCIENEILMLLRSSKKYSQDVSLNDPIGTDRDGNEIVIMDVISAENDTIAEQVDLKIQTKKLYEKLRTVLKERERLVIEMRYGLNGEKEVTQQEIAKILGISRSYVSRIEKKALKKLNSEMNS